MSEVSTATVKLFLVVKSVVNAHSFASNKINFDELIKTHIVDITTDPVAAVEKMQSETKNSRESHTVIPHVLHVPVSSLRFD